MSLNVTDFLDKVKRRNANEPEFLQAVEEVAESIIPFINENPKYQNKAILDRIVEPERVIMFRVAWMDDKQNIQVNRGYRVQMNSAIGPYKGGLRFHPSVNLSILKFLAFEQTFKNSLTSLAMGGGKGGSDFDPKGKSDNEVMRFCQSFMQELYRHVGQNTDVPAGDIGVGGREIGYLFGMYKKLANNFSGVITGKGLSFGGSLIRPEATGYGAVYFAQNMFNHIDDDLKGKSILISGSGNVAQYAAEKAIQLGAKVLTLSDSKGCIYVEHGITTELLEEIKDLKNVQRKGLSSLANQHTGLKYVEGGKPWEYACDVAFPCATQNELNLHEAKALIDKGVKAIVEGANMPCTNEAVEEFIKNNVLFAPGKASNAGGVATSGLEMSQNSARLSWTHNEVDEKLKEIMVKIHNECVEHGKEGETINYVKGANIAGFVKVADAMLAQGIV